MVTHHGEFKVAVTAVCQQKKTGGWGSSGKEGEGERREERAVRHKERKKEGEGGQEVKILENQNRWETGNLKTTAHNSKCSPSLHTHTQRN